MSRVFWVLVGAGLTLLLVVRGKQWMRRFTPKGVQEQVVEKSHAVAASLGDVMATFRMAMAEREAELRHELNITATSND